MTVLPEIELPPGELNRSQRLHLRVSCEYIDKLLGEIEEIIRSPESKSPFPRYANDVSPAEIRVLEHYIRRLRTQLVRTLAWQRISPSNPEIPARRAILTHLNFVGIALDDLRPKEMRGGGPLSSEVADQLNGVVHELRTLEEEMERLLRMNPGTSPEARLDRLETSGHDVALLRTLREVIERNGMHEFRARLNLLLTSLEEQTFEIALFGRVSSGKSSLLNALLGSDVLPVGTTPITAVPVRLQYGESTSASISFSDGHTECTDPGTFASMVSETGNPSNEKCITRALVRLPSPRLREGVALVDTPGLGSLARSGARETLAYLPACDLALLLIDAGGTLNEEDVETLRLLYEAGIPSFVLLSKADLLSEIDLARTIHYTEQRLKEQLHASLNVHPVSALPERVAWLDSFYRFHLDPLFERAHELRGRPVHLRPDDQWGNRGLCGPRRCCATYPAQSALHKRAPDSRHRACCPHPRSGFDQPESHP